MPAQASIRQSSKRQSHLGGCLALRTRVYRLTYAYMYVHTIDNVDEAKVH